ncbi:MAG: imidazolonepropionase-like amidohydrolase/Tol biopolymer transport system component [Neolewinella sp.]
MRHLLTTLCLLLPLLTFAQDKKKWDVSAPTGDWDWKTTSFTTTEGTWMSVDLSPDGKTIAFDMLGDIYTLPIKGGKAKPVRAGIPWEVQPRFSPDGKHLLFTSDAGGGDNIWVKNLATDSVRQVTKESFRLLNNAAWTPDGQYFVARKHFTSGRSLGAGEMWLYHISGGTGIQLTKRKNDQQDVNEPSVSPDGRYVYYSEDMYPGGLFQYNKDPNDQIYVIKRLDRETGEIKTVVGGPGGAFRPQISHDGKKLAFIRRVRTKTVLHVMDLESGRSYPIFSGLSKDQQEAWAIFGAYTGYDWTADDKEIVVWGGGKLWRVPTVMPANGKENTAKEIPFSVDVDIKVSETVRFKNNAFDESFDAKVIRHAVTSPDGKTLAFSALGHLYTMSLPDSTPTRLTDEANFEFEPSFSADGKTIAYVTWSDDDLGSIKTIAASGGRAQKVSKTPGIFRAPSFAPDGKTIAYFRESGNNHQGYAYCQEPGVYTIPTADGEENRISKSGQYPVFNQKGDRVFFQKGGVLFGALSKEYCSVKAIGGDERTHLNAKHAQRFSVSPDNKWVAWSELHKVFVAPFPMTGNKVTLAAKGKNLPVAQVAKDAGINLHWSADSKRLNWTLGNQLFTNELTERFLFLEGAVDSVPPMDTTGILIKLNVVADKPDGRIALTNARIITMEGDEVIERGTIILNGNKIEKMGARTRVPSGVKSIDCTGKTIMPGIVDVHGHLGDFRYGLSPQRNWYYYANLAYGVTTAHDPSSNSEMIFSHSEMIKSGEMIGPRLFSTGTILYGAEGDFKAPISNLEDARSAIRRTKAYGAFSVKSYNQPRREQRQQIIQASRELGIIVVPEGGSTFHHNMNMLTDGHTGVEHNIPVAPLFRDVQQFWKSTEAHNTPTLIVNYGGVNGEYYWYQNTKVWEQERLLTFTPRGIVDGRSRHRTMIPDEEYDNGYKLTSRSLSKLNDLGVGINLGSHGQLQGLGAHWELWMIGQGGISNHDALKAATINGAKYLGMDHQIGSLKEGKLADLIIIDGNPLADLRDSEKITHTIINGRVYDAKTLNEVGIRQKERGKLWFEQDGSGNNWPAYQQGFGAAGEHCACRGHN